MSRAQPGPSCYDVLFRAAYPVTEAAEVALEDYARTLLRSAAAEAMRAEDDLSVVTGVHLCGLGRGVDARLLVDLEDFARSLVNGTGSGLGW